MRNIDPPIIEQTQARIDDLMKDFGAAFDEFVASYCEKKDISEEDFNAQWDIDAQPFCDDAREAFEEWYFEDDQD